MNNNEKYTKYIYITESGDISMLMGEMPEPEQRMTADEMRYYLYDKRFQIEWEKEEPLDEDDDENEVWYTILPVFSEELTPEENMDMIWEAYNSDYIDGPEFISFHESQLRELLGDEKFDELKAAIDHHESLDTFYIRETVLKCIHAEKCTREEFLSELKETSEEEYLSVDGDLFRNDGIDVYGDRRWFKYEESRNDWTNMWDVEEEV